MKKIFFILFFFVSLVASAQQQNSLVIEGVRLIPPYGECLYMPFECNGKIGFARITSSLIVVIKPTYDDIYNDSQKLCDGMFLVKKDGKWGALDSKNDYGITNSQIPCEYDTMTPFRKNEKGILCSKVSKNGKVFYIDRKGNIL